MLLLRGCRADRRLRRCDERVLYVWPLELERDARPASGLTPRLHERRVLGLDLLSDAPSPLLEWAEDDELDGKGLIQAHPLSLLMTTSEEDLVLTPGGLGELGHGRVSLSADLPF